MNALADFSRASTRSLLKKSVTLMALAGATIASSVSYAAGEVNVYSARKEALIAPALDAFSKAHDVTVNLVTGDADALLRRLQVEGDASPADVFITVDAGRLYRAKDAGVLQSFETDVLNDVVPDNLHDRDGYWYGLSQRARVIFYNPKKVDAAADMIALNAGAAIYVSGLASDWQQGVRLAHDVIASGQAAEKIKELADFTAALKRSE